ncbi:MAG: gamma-glutamylcyclotransferase [Rhizobacter sp.]
MSVVLPLRPLSPEREPAHLLAQTRAAWGGHGDLWVFGYASLIWRPEFDSIEQRQARVHGWHRALEMQSRINRGTPECPGLVFALVGGGSCRGMVYRIARDRVEDELPRLWAREMPNSVYDPRWLSCHTDQGVVTALAFTLSRESPNYTGTMDDAHLLNVLRHASGRYGTTLAYVLETARALRAHGIRDRGIEHLVSLAQRNALTA